MSIIEERIELVGWDHATYVLTCYPMIIGYAINMYDKRVPIGPDAIVDLAADELYDLAERYPGWCESVGSEPNGKVFWTLLKRNVDHRVIKVHSRFDRFGGGSLEALLTGADGEGWDGPMLLPASEVERLRRPSHLQRVLCDEIAVMPTRWKVLLALRFHEELSVREVGEIIGQSGPAAAGLLRTITHRFRAIALRETLDHPEPLDSVSTKPWVAPFELHRWIWLNTKWPDLPTYLGMAQRDYEADVSYMVDMLLAGSGTGVLYGARTSRPEKYAPCGSESAHSRHKKQGEQIDAECAAAHEAYKIQRLAQRRADEAARARGELVPDRRRGPKPRIPTSSHTGG